MASPIIFTVTNAGVQALSGGNITLSSIVIGTGTGTAAASKTALSGEIASANIISGGVETISEVLRLSAVLSLDTPADIHEVGIKTTGGILFAVALSGSQPFFSLDETDMMASFGVALDGFNSSRVSVQSDSKASKALSIVEEHLAIPNPHPQYLSIGHLDDSTPHEQYVDKVRAQDLLRVMIPIGYIYRTHSTTSPKPIFDALLGVDTAWRRLTGVMIVATDPADRFIQSARFSLGQRGMTSASTGQQPNFYNLQTSHTWERINPYDVLYDGKHKYDGNANYQ